MDTWRFWIIHLWVEGFFELVTVMVAIIFYYLGIVSGKTAARVVYLDAVLYLGSGIVGTGHHWYWTGQSDSRLFLGTQRRAAVHARAESVPGGILQLLDVFRNGYWHARSPLFMSTPTMHFIEWLRMPADLIFIGLGVLPLLIAGVRIYTASFGAARREPAGIPVTGIPSAVRSSGD